MQRIRLYKATSLIGKIARKDGSVNWLEAVPKETSCTLTARKQYSSGVVELNYRLITISETARTL